LGLKEQAADDLRKSAEAMRRMRALPLVLMCPSCAQVAEFTEGVVCSKCGEPWPRKGDGYQVKCNHETADFEEDWLWRVSGDARPSERNKTRGKGGE
jgi:predicted amidophosphoribosyltransferase